MERITRKELIDKYISFFKEKGHAEIKNSSLLPENDPTVLFTTAGMQPIVPFLLGQPHPLGKRLVNVQRCIRTVDIDRVGDSYHHSFFEMIGNWSLGDYWKDEAIKLTFKFLTEKLKIPLNKLSITCFKGNKDIEKDTESAKIWESLGIQKERIAFLEDNWWGPAGKIGPCGPNTEIFYWKPSSPPPKTFDPNDEENWVEIGNDVLLAFNKDDSGKYTKLKQKNIDFGGGTERIVTALNNLEDNYLTDIWQPLIKEIEKISKRPYNGNEKSMRIIADHIKASIFAIADGVVPTNTEQGYILRRLIRRAIRHAKNLEIPTETDITTPIVEATIKIYSKTYPHLEKNKQKIIDELNSEKDKFEKTLDKGLKEFKKMSVDKKISCKQAFLLFQSYGFPIEMIEELAKESNVIVDCEGFYKEMECHQELSRTSCSGKFKSGLSDNTEATKKLHTATHLLNESLRIILNNPNIQQKGSNITPERLRFDFNFERKLTPKEIQDVEDMVNLKIKANLPIICEIMPLKKAKETGAQGVFEDKYNTDVNVYRIGSIAEEFSKEICAGPHVNNTSELGTFKIQKEESSSSGIRRIKAVLE